MGDENQTEDLSLHDELASAFAEAGGDPPVNDFDAGAPVPPAPPETQQQIADRQRDEQGRFAKALEQEQNSPQVVPPLAGQGSAQPAPISPPPSWSATAKAEFLKASPVIQQEVLKREKDMEAGNAQWQEKGERLNRLDAILAPRRERHQLAGLDDVRAVQTLFAAQDYLERDPYAAIAYLARQSGVDLTRYANGGAQMQAAQPPMHPQLQALLNEVNSLKGTVSQQQSAQQDAARTGYVQQVQAFASDPKNLYFANVERDMAALITSGQAQGLQDAYEKATWAHPEIRPLLIAEQSKAQGAASQARANAARQASGSVIGSPMPGSAPANGGPAPSLREELERAFSASA